MYKKNLKKYYSMEKEIKQLTAENEKLSIKMRELNSADNYKLKFEEASQVMEKLKVENENINKQNNKLRQELEYINSELEQAKEKLNKVENEKKLKNYQLEEKATDKDVLENLKLENTVEERIKWIEEATRKQATKEGLEEGFKHGIEQGIEQGIKQNTIQLIKSMLANGASYEFIEKVTGKSIREIKKIEKRN